MASKILESVEREHHAPRRAAALAILRSLSGHSFVGNARRKEAL